MSVNPGLPVALALAGLLVLTLVGYRVGSLPGARQAVVSGARALVQLSLAGLVITAVVDSIVASVALITAMFAVAARTASGRIDAPRRWADASMAMACGVLPSLAVVLATQVIPFVGIALIPVAGILIGNAMTALTLLGRRANSAIADGRGQLEAALTLGMVRQDAIRLVVHRHVPEALIPGLDQVRTAGVVTLPGAFIGVMLGGGSPAQAASAQLIVLFGVMATQTLTVVVAQRLIERTRLLPPALAQSLPPG